MRSGTNWLGALLNLHPRINCRGEYHFERLADAFERWAAYHADSGVGARVVETSREALRDTVRRCLKAGIDAKPEADWQGDRTPHHVDRLVPGAPTVCILRDGRDVVVSRLFHTIRRGFVPGPDGVNARERFEADPGHYTEHPEQLLGCEDITRFMARGWAEHIARDAEAILGACDDVFPVRYEAVRAQPEAERRRVYEFFGLNPDEAAALSAEDKTEPGFDRGEDASSFYRAGVAGGWPKYFTDDAKQWFKDEAQPALELCGYEANADW